MEHTITLTDQQEEAFKQLGTPLEDYIDSQIKYVESEYIRSKAIETYDIVQADPDLKGKVDVKIEEQKVAQSESITNEL